MSRRMLCDVLVCSCEITNRQYDRCFTQWLSSMDHGLLCKSPFSLFSAWILPVARVLSILMASFISIVVIEYLLILFWMSFESRLKVLFVMNINRFSLYCFTFLEWFDCRSRDIYFYCVDERITQVLSQFDVQKWCTVIGGNKMSKRCDITRCDKLWDGFRAEDEIDSFLS